MSQSSMYFIIMVYSFGLQYTFIQCKKWLNSYLTLEKDSAKFLNSTYYNVQYMYNPIFLSVPVISFFLCMGVFPWIWMMLLEIPSMCINHLVQSCLLHLSKGSVLASLFSVFLYWFHHLKTLVMSCMVRDACVKCKLWKCFASRFNHQVLQKCDNL